MTDGGCRRAAVILCRQDCVPAAGDREGPCEPNVTIWHHHLANQTIREACPTLRRSGTSVHFSVHLFSACLLCRCANVEGLISMVR
jgi:hypothetical protein